MTLDTKPLAFLFLAILIISFFCLFSLLRHNSAVPVLKFWIAIVITIFLGLLTLIFRDKMQLEYSILITNLCMLTGHMLMWIAARKHSNRPLRLKAFGVVFLICLFAFFWFTFLEPNINNRLLITWLLAFPCSLGAACAYLMSPAKELTAGVKLMAFAMLLNAAKWAYLLITIPLDFEKDMLFSFDTLGVTAMLLFNIAIATTFTISAALIVVSEVSKYKNANNGGKIRV